MEDLYKRSPTPTEQFEGYDGEEWDVVGITEEEINVLGDSYLSIQWAKWSRADGSNTTWIREDNKDDDINGTDLPKKFREKMKKDLQSRVRAAKSLEINLDTISFSSMHDTLTAEMAEAVEFKVSELAARFEVARQPPPDEDMRSESPDLDVTHDDLQGRSVRKRRASTSTIQSGSSRPMTRRRVGTSSGASSTMAGPSRAGSVSSAGSDPAATASRMRKSRREAEDEWNKAARSARVERGVRISIVNEVDQEEIPELPQDFRWLESVYANPPRQKEMLIYCTCTGRCKIGRGCSCLDSSVLPDGCPAAYTRDGLIHEILADSRDPFLANECNHKCKCDRSCFNRVSQKPRDVSLEIFKTANNRGWGVRSRTALPKGKVIGICTGKLEYEDSSDEDPEVIEVDSEGDTVMRDDPPAQTLQTRLACNGYCFSLDWDGADDAWINAYNQGNWTRFVNHSCNPNLRYFTVRRGEMSNQGEVSYVAMATIEDIPARAELVVNYQQGATHGRRAMKSKLKGKGKKAARALEQCRCGFAGCRGSVWD